MYDAIIVGAGVVGSAIARELSAYNLNICVLERKSDVCEGTSKANSGIVHAGYDAAPGSLMARFNVEGAKLMPKICRELDVPFVQNGSLVLCFSKRDLPKLQNLYEQGKQNGVRRISIISGKRARKLEPCLSKDVVAALYAPKAGIVDPFLLTVAYAENAASNGATFLFDQQVVSVAKAGEGFEVKTHEKTYHARAVINAAGLFSDVLYTQAKRDRQAHITPRRGSYVLLDRAATPVPAHTLFQLPTAYGKGVLVAPTCHGNTIVGPTAVDIDDKEGVNTTAKELKEVMGKARLSVPDLPLNQAITSFAGLRAHEDGHEFLIEETESHYFHLVGIESPGLTSSPALAKYVADKVAKACSATKNPHFCSKRKAIVRFVDATSRTQKKLLRENPAYGKVVCRCEHVTEAEIQAALQSPIPPRSLDAVKRRLRAGMGRCQGGFCSPHVMRILAEDKPLYTVLKANAGSYIVGDYTKGREQVD